VIPSIRKRWAKALAFAFLDGDWTEEGLIRRGGLVLEHTHPMLRSLVMEVIQAYPRPPWDRWRELASWIGLNPALEAAVAEGRNLSPTRWLPFQPAMADMPWPVPPIPTIGELGHFLALSTSELAWFADVHSLERRVNDEQLRHYRYRWIQKTSGGLRLIEAPKGRLRELQRTLLRTILDRIPIHSTAHGFVRGRSPLSFVLRHSGAEVVIRLDLEDFFGSVTAGRVFGVFRTAGYPESVAYTLAGLTTNVVPLSVWQGAPQPTDATRLHDRFQFGKRLAVPHLPQGAPSSPALANLCAHRLDGRLSGLATAFGLRYSRYADDLAISGSPGHSTTERVIGLIRAVVAEEGFRINESKTSVMAKGHRQRLAGIVVNRVPNLPRRDFDRLRAILHNAARDGLEAQNRFGHPRFSEHLAGRVSWAASLNPGRAPALRKLLASATERQGT
jgi:RNA-directed DNA polymerase